MKCVITGCAGTLGKAFTKHLLKEGLEVVGIDNSEWAIVEYQNTFPEVKTYLMDFVDYRFTDEDYIIHLAAYKHVNLGETERDSFWKNNVEKTEYLFKRAELASVKILFMSTDKAVEPCSFYGITKMRGEILAEKYGGIVARSGNVLNSTGSVIPIWEQAIKEQKPIKITDWDMERYVIDADKCASECWSRFVLGFPLVIPPMGEPKKLKEIVEEVLKLHGYDKLEDYTPGFEVVGLRPGERLKEKLRWDYE